MKLLLDTHVLLWWAEEREELSGAARLALADGNNAVYVSAVTAWEMAIKHATGKLKTPDDLPGLLAANNFMELPVTIDHAMEVKSLPLHHRDPFDRMLAAQARTDRLTLVSRDPVFRRYGIPLLIA